jgi:TonB family protein
VRSEPLPTDVASTYWWESPIALALMGAIAIHLIIGTFGDALVVLNPIRPDPPPPPKLELVDVEVPAVVQPPPPVRAPDPDPIKPQPAVTPTKIATHTHSEPVVPPPETPPPATTQPEGGGLVVAMPDVAPGATGVAVAKGAVNTGHVGRGNHGTGTGAGNGSGTEAPAPMSVATIKTRALPRSDYSYEESKDYPAEAKQLSIGGKIRVKLVVDTQGNVKSAVLLNRLGHGLDELALSRATRILFDPAKDSDDKPVASVVVWTFDMSPPK